MESPDANVKSPGRLRSKSSRLSTSPNPSNMNLNGEEDITELNKSLEDKEDDIFESSTDDVLSADQKNEDFDSKAENKTVEKVRQESKPMKGRKRKASEMKSSDENTSDEPPTKDKPALREDEEKFESTPEDDILKTDDKIVSDSTSDIGISLDMKTDAHSLGKGKRARVPNKRYSDFPLKSSRLSQSELVDELDKSRPNLENGEAKESTEHTESTVDLKDDGSEKSSAGSPNIILKTNSSIRASRTGSPSTPAVKKAKPPVDLSNPCYLKPFKYGWKRELVYRATNDINTNKRNGDIYYYTPNGRKVRSMREVSENLKNKELTLDDFTFFKEPLGIDDPEKEIIRDAKIKTSTPLTSKKSTPKVTRTPKVSSPKPTTVAESQVDSTNKAKASPRRTSFKVKLPSRGVPQSKPKVEKKTSKNDSDLDIGTYPPNWTSPVPKKPSKTPTSLSTTDKPCRPCSIRCQGVSGIIPTLQCRICLCLYHFECVGQSPHSAIQGYVCKNCQLEQDPNTGCTSTVAPPPLTPINALKSIHTQSTTLPKLQRIPRPNESDTDLTSNSQPLGLDDPSESFPQSDLPRLTPRPTLLPKTTSFTKTSDTVTMPPLQIENKSIVGSVTTWFPSSSTIQVNAGNSPTSISENILVSQQRPQHVEFLGNKQFLIIPKQNILAICPNFPTSATAPTSKQIDQNTQLKVAAEGSTDIASTPDSASLGPAVEVSAIKTEPTSPLKSSDPTPSPAQEPMEVQPSESDKIPDDTTVRKRPEDILDNDQEGKKKKQKIVAASKSESETEDYKFMDSYLQNVAYGYNTLLYVFQYLKVQDLLRASCVCSMWRDIASHPMLWKTVRMKNSQIHNFGGLADALEKHGTVHLDLRKMLLPSTSGDDIWQEFTREIEKVSSLRKIELCRCPAFVVEQLPISNPKLQVINSVTIKCETMSLAPMIHLKELQELRLKSTAGFALTSDLTALSDLKHLKHLSLTSIKELNKLNIDVIADLRNLESLELGECTDFPKNFGSEILTRLTKLEKLRLEKGQGNCYTFEILEAVKNMQHLYQLELVNFDIKPGFDLALGACPNIKKLLIIPTYISQSATTNHMVLGGVLRLQSTLSQFVWGVTLELLRVTELFVDQCEEDKDKKEKRPIANGDSIPVLKPVPLAREGMAAEILPAQEPPQVEILPLPNLQKLLLSSLPTTRVKILKIPFHATWRQSIHDSVN